MMENTLSSRLQMTMRRLTGRGSLTEKDIDEMMRDVRLSLLEADVNLKVVKTFVANVKEKALGEGILKGLNPGQQVVKIVHDELKLIMGEETQGLNFNNNLTTIMTIGLQGSGKTTAIGKMGVWIRKHEKKRVMFIAADVYRPAAIDQLVTIGREIGIEVYEEGIKDAREIVANGLKYAKKEKYDVAIIDTAGRLHIDEEMMQELVDVKAISNPNEILLTVDAMTGQEAANITKSFHDQLGATGAILTKLDGDTRGGAALSIREISGIPIKFMSMGEQMDTLEVFHPERMASRILGMGDVLTLIEKATDAIDEQEAEAMMEKMLKNQFNYNDMKKQMKSIKKMGSISKILGFLPGAKQIKEAVKNIDDKQFDIIVTMIDSMTKQERLFPKLVDDSGSRRKRIAEGAGVKVSDVNNLRESLKQQQKMMQQMSNMSETDLKKMQNNPEQMMRNTKSSSGSKGKGKGKGQWRR